MAKEIAEEYASSLADLTVNSKPLINMLTILAEENIDHAAVIVETVEKHLEKVPSEIKLPVLYLVDSIIKNVGGAYTQKFSQSIVNMFTSTFKKVDEKIRAQMFKLRETWHDVFPATKLYQLDVKVNLIDPAWPIQAQPQQSNIHVNPNFLKKQTPVAVSNVGHLSEEEEKMRIMLAKKEQELLMLQRKKVEMELEQTRKQLELAEKRQSAPISAATIPSTSMPVALVNPVMAPVMPVVTPDVPVNIPIKQRLGPPVNKAGRIAPVSAALATARRDPRLARRPQPQPQPQPQIQPQRIAPNVFDIQPLDRRGGKRQTVLTIDVPQPDKPTARDPRLDRQRKRRDKDDKKPEESNIIDKLLLPVPKKISKLPPIPKINREGKDSPTGSPNKKHKDAREKDKKKKRDDSAGSKDSSSSGSPEKKNRKEPSSNNKKDQKDKKSKPEKKSDDKPENEVVQFKELKNFNKGRYRRNREKSESPEKVADIIDTSNAPEILESKDVDLRVLPSVELKPASIAQKRSSTETVETRNKKSKVDKFDILFGSEDVDLRQLPQVEELLPPPPPIIEPLDVKTQSTENSPRKVTTPELSPKTKDWHQVKEKEEKTDKKTPSKLDIVRAKLAEATKGKQTDRLGRPLLFTKSPSVDKDREERRRSLSLSGDIEDTDMRHENGEEFDAEDHKKTISIIMSQAKEQYNDGQLDKNQYNTLMYQVLQLNEKLKLKEAKQRESLEISKRKLKAQIEEDSKEKKPAKVIDNKFGDIDERINPPPAFVDIVPESTGFLQDSDMRINGPIDNAETMNHPRLRPPMIAPPNFPRINGPGFPNWRGQMRPRVDEYVPRNRFRGPGGPPFFRGKFNPRGPRPAFDPSLPIALPTPQMGICQGPCPLVPYERSSSPPPLGAPGIILPPTDFSIIEYIDQDPVKTIQIDGIHREIRFYGETAIIMLDWDDPREIKFLPGCRRVTFDNKDSVVLSFNEGYKQVEIDDQVFDIRFGAPTRELYINGHWHECFFGGAPFGVLIDGKPRLVHLEGPLPQVDIGKERRTDLVAGKINLIVNATQMCPVYLDAKVQKFVVNGNVFTIRFVDALRTVLINEKPFSVKYGDLPEPVYIGNEKYFVRFSALPRNVKPGHVQIVNMEGSCLPQKPVIPFENIHIHAMEVDQEEAVSRPDKTPSPDGESRGLDMLASLMPSNLPTAPASASEYSLAEPIFGKSGSIPGLDTSTDEKQNAKPSVPDLNVTDLLAKLVAAGIVSVPAVKNEVKEEVVTNNDDKDKEMKEDRSVVHPVDLLKPETLRGKQRGLVSRLYGGMQCGECGARFPPERTVRYSQHLDWHFRRNRRRRAPAANHWYYDLPDWIQYLELPDLDQREKNWFESAGSDGSAPEVIEREEEAPSVAAGDPQHCSCALCGDTFAQFYNDDDEEWHLRNSVRHEGNNYHPACLEDYKASLVKEKTELPTPETESFDLPIDKVEEAIEITDADINDESDNESVVEVTADEEAAPEPVEIVEEEGDEDDVVLKTEPVVQVEVDDDHDTDDETVAERKERDRVYEVDLSKVKKEPVENDDDVPVITEEEQVLQPAIETSQTRVLSSIDGNVQFETAPTPSISLGGIRINISKAIPTVVETPDKMLDNISLDEEPLPPGEEPELEYKLKPSLEGIHFRRQPPIIKGNELSGLCSIM